LSDTVGFISDLPTMLVAAFRATLEEVAESDIIVHVRDIHHPDTEAQREDVLGVLTELGLGERVEGGMIEALNKVDLMPKPERAALMNQIRRNRDAVPISATTGEGCDKLMELLDTRLDVGRQKLKLDVPLTDGAALAWLYDHGAVMSRKDDDSMAHLVVKLSEADLGRFRGRH